MISRFEKGDVLEVVDGAFFTGRLVSVEEVGDREVTLKVRVPRGAEIFVPSHFRKVGPVPMGDL